MQQHEGAEIEEDDLLDEPEVSLEEESTENKEEVKHLTRKLHLINVLSLSQRRRSRSRKKRQKTQLKSRKIQRLKSCLGTDIKILI